MRVVNITGALRQTGTAGWVIVLESSAIAVEPDREAIALAGPAVRAWNLLYADGRKPLVRVDEAALKAEVKRKRKVKRAPPVVSQRKKPRRAEKPRDHGPARVCRKCRRTLPGSDFAEVNSQRCISCRKRAKALRSDPDERSTSIRTVSGGAPSLGKRR